MNDTMEQMFKTWQDATLDTVSCATKHVTNSESWFTAMNAQMDVYNAGVKKVRQTVAASLEALDLPKREDLARLSAQVLAAETRTAECEDRLDRADAELKALYKRLAELERTAPKDTEIKAPEIKAAVVKTAKTRRNSK